MHPSFDGDYNDYYDNHYLGGPRVAPPITKEELKRQPPLTRDDMVDHVPSYGDGFEVLKNSRCMIGNAATAAAYQFTKFDNKKKKLTVSKVTIEEISGDLKAGVNSRLMSEIDASTVYAHPKDLYYHKELDESERTEKGGQIVTIESIAKWEDMVNVYEPWAIFLGNGISVEGTMPTAVNHVKKSLYRFCQKFIVRLTKPSGFLQLYCNTRKIKYIENFYKEGDVITIFLRDKSSTPPMFTVIPRTQEQVFVPMREGQRLQIVSDKGARVEFSNRGILNYLEKEQITNSKFKTPREYQADLFECSAFPKVAEFIHCYVPTAKQWRTVVVPFAFKDEPKMPLIVDPPVSSMIYAHNIEGFILRSYNHKPLHIFAKDNHLKIVCTREENDFYEAKVKINKSQPYLWLDRQAGAWVAKSNF